MSDDPKPCKSPTSVWIPRMPKRLREHIRVKEMEWEAVRAPIPWPCARCKKEFTPHRNPLWWFNFTGKEWNKFCDDCQIRNIIDGISESREERDEFRNLLKR